MGGGADINHQRSANLRFGKGEEVKIVYAKHFPLLTIIISVTSALIRNYAEGSGMSHVVEAESLEYNIEVVIKHISDVCKLYTYI